MGWPFAGRYPLVGEILLLSVFELDILDPVERMTDRNAILKKPPREAEAECVRRVALSVRALLRPPWGEPIKAVIIKRGREKISHGD